MQAESQENSLDRQFVESIAGNPLAGELEFRGGWLASGVDHLPVPRDWHRRSLGHLNVAVHPFRDHCVAIGATAGVLLVGWAVDTSARLWSQELIVVKIQSLLEEHGWDSALRYVAYLGGRFMVIAVRGDEVRFIPDAAATLSAYSAGTESATWVGSHATLVADQVGAQPDHGLREFLATARRASGYVVFRPGVRGDYIGVRQLLPNHYWELSGTNKIAHERFYPFDDTVLDERCGGLERFAVHFDRHMEAICSLPRGTVSLTGGNDSGATLAGFRRHRQEDSFTWTLVDPGTPSQVKDAASAGRRAAAAGIAHVIVPKEFNHDPNFERAAKRTFATGLQAFGFTSSTYSGLPHDIVNTQSMLAEIGTGFYKNRELRKPTAANLARTYSAQPHGASPYAKEAFAEFIEYGSFQEDLFGPWSWYDMLYWESRAGLWSAIRIAELELSHRVEMPYNSRHVLEALASGTWRERQARDVQRTYMLLP